MARRRNRDPSSEEASEDDQDTPMEVDEKAPQTTILFRDSELSMLETLFSSASLRTAVFVNGGRGCGKSSILHQVTCRCKDPVVYVNCRFHETEAQLTADIYAKLSSFPSLAPNFNKASPWKKVPDMQRSLKQWPAVSLVVVLDGIECVAKATDFLPGLIHPSSTSPVALRLVLVSRHPWQSFMFANSKMPEVIEIPLRSYTKDELVQLVLQIFDMEEADNEEKELLKSFSTLIVQTYFPITKDVREFRAHAQRHFPRFTSPITEGTAKANQSNILYQKFLPVITAELRSNPADQAKSSSMAESMPLLMRYLLVACYLCSFNPSKADARMVSKRHEKVRKETGPSARKKAKDKRLTVLGPQNFSLERLCSNFFSLTAELEIKFTMGQILSGLRTLCGLQLILRVSAEENINFPKFRCICEKSRAVQAATSLGLELNRYLIDLV
ncbi:hypothetical protein RvY_05971 [Ramazzottius varieornatus]|uniref:Uncharacterized protein n=1 Tax=Ramazzottius varieornatus TaxID=947166 RepID=A0A1D1V0F8_RAMVA|nr:hypothetical protein RvY_05971 [Ramazzottius varieornatus]